MELIDKFVNFGEYCPKCLYNKSQESDDPCWECLLYPTNTYSHKPIKFIEDKKKEK